MCLTVLTVFYSKHGPCIIQHRNMRSRSLTNICKEASFDNVTGLLFLEEPYLFLGITAIKMSCIFSYIFT